MQLAATYRHFSSDRETALGPRCCDGEPEKREMALQTALPMSIQR